MKQLKHYLKEKKERNSKRNWLKNLISLFLEKGLKVEEQMVYHINYFNLFKSLLIFCLLTNILISYS